MSVTVPQIVEALRKLPYPGFDRDVVSLGVVSDIQVDGGNVRVALDPGPDASAGAALVDAMRRAIEEIPGVSGADVRLAGRPAGSDALRMVGAKKRPSVAAAGALDPDLIPGVTHTIAVASGKGGVGKSTVAVNLAVALAAQGLRVGLMDADIYGPSVPLMTGIRERARVTAEHVIVPFERFGVRLMSLGFMIEPDSAVIWRGPLVMKAIDELLRTVAWGELDILVVDMPPGTGDAQLTLTQRVQLAGAVIVTTPQDVALADARKGAAMFGKVGVPVLGIIENMSYFECPNCAQRTEIFSHGGGIALAEKLGVEALGQIPLDPEIRHGGDEGEPLVHRRPQSPQAVAFVRIATRIRELLRIDPEQPSAAPPGIFDRFRNAISRNDD